MPHRRGRRDEARAELKRLEKTAELDILAKRAAGLGYLALRLNDWAIDHF